MQTPYITTRQMLADQFAKEWQELYRKFQANNNTSALVEYAREFAVAENDHPTPEQVEAVRGNATRLVCNQCDKDVNVVITVGESAEDYDSCTASLCLECVEKVHSLAVVALADSK